MITFDSVPPSSPLASVIDRFFITSGQFPAGQKWENKLLPSIMQSIIIDFNSTPPWAKFPGRQSFACPGDLIMGQFTKSCISTLEGNFDFIGVQFAPTGMFRLLNLNMAQFSNTILPLNGFVSWHGSLRQSLEQVNVTMERITIIEHFIANHLTCNHIYLNKIEQAAELIQKSKGKITIPSLCEITGMSERSFQRYFKQYVGVSPKAFAQIARFNAVTKMIEEQNAPSWQHIQDETGYFDAAHFVNDFKRITEKTPSAYYKGKTHYEKFFNAS